MDGALLECTHTHHQEHLFMNGHTIAHPPTAPADRGGMKRRRILCERLLKKTKQKKNSEKLWLIKQLKVKDLFIYITRQMRRVTKIRFTSTVSSYMVFFIALIYCIYIFIEIYEAVHYISLKSFRLLHTYNRGVFQSQT